MSASLTNLRAELGLRFPDMTADASANHVMLRAGLYIKHLERAFASLSKEKEGEDEDGPLPASTRGNGTATTPTAEATTSLNLHESPKVSGQEALIPFGSPHSALREISRNLEGNTIPDNDADLLAELLDQDSFLLDLLK